MKEILENKEICSSCGGKCCKKCGCDYAPKDFENLTIDYLQSKLEEGNISIVSTLIFDKLKNGKITCIPFLYLRARNINRPVVDLLSLKTTCKMLKIDGCPYTFEQRPTGAKNIIPSKNQICKPKEDPKILIIDAWKNYQKILSRLVKRLTGYSVDERLSMDVENLFNDIKLQNFSYVSKLELDEIKELIPILAQAYPEQLKKATETVVQNSLEVSYLLLKLKSQI